MDQQWSDIEGFCNALSEDSEQRLSDIESQMEENPPVASKVGKFSAPGPLTIPIPDEMEWDELHLDMVIKVASASNGSYYGMRISFDGINYPLNSNYTTYMLYPGGGQPTNNSIVFTETAIGNTAAAQPALRVRTVLVNKTPTENFFNIFSDTTLINPSIGIFQQHVRSTRGWYPGGAPEEKIAALLIGAFPVGSGVSAASVTASVYRMKY
jgi:hypothetical protein